MNLKEKYNQEVIKAMKAQFGYKNNLAVPKIVKVTLNVGVGRAKDDPKAIEVAESTLSRISGQKPVVAKAKKSISAFKLREGMNVGLKVTLRGQRMWDFLTKLVGISLPRVRDFRGLSVKSVDQQGNLNLGFKENIMFPEIRPDEVEKIHGLEVSITTTADSYEAGLALFGLLGFPFKKE
ncbi:TPA: 50S ribosomal protein L5 [Candidatus Komeilibacteria bacterium]|nr:MAG: 50S ribosomal protein L5 [Parcubacteria group bacterium GW2011_GWC2_45_15]OGY93344.1 MAG: 50S ribosomal protein L5 [Candidatus Komeilibacteria bacterium RIFOXYC2_FULL_45_12]OGY94923.1 MAG: 50S ribosomal protein L5 [Candidatus Komeilibacteria bacterium RIFOXYA2_FULL_45_9]HAH03950.1 50S ribosomal protein L5 [Candidatus Komeilibacteria bacterium]HBR13510.1 50S ribosomal protein L5 [Candidatus Komeilibacteria bacterium]